MALQCPRADHSDSHPMSEFSSATSQDTWFLTLPRYENSRAVGWQHINAISMHVNCTLYVTSDNPSTVIAFYKKFTHGAMKEYPEGGLKQR